MADGTKRKSKGKANREIIITRVFDAPREMIWDAWTDPKQIVKWWGPRGFTITIHEMDVRPGGTWKSMMLGPDGTEYLNNCVFHQVVKPECISYQLTGGRQGDRDVQAEVRWIFEAQGEKTKLTLHMLFPTSQACDRAAKKYKVVEGGNETVDRLGEHLAKHVLDGR